MGEVIKKDSIVMLTQGEYSDYEAITIARAVTDFDIAEIRKEWFSIHPEQEERYSADIYGFVKWLCVDKCYLEELDYIEFHLGSYAIMTDDEEYTTRIPERR